MTDIHDYIADGRYKNNVLYSLPKPEPTDDMTIAQARELTATYEQQRRDQRARYSAEEARLRALFEEDLAVEHGLFGHPKASAVFSMAWSDGHSGGLEDVAARYAELADLVK